VKKLIYAENTPNNAGLTIYGDFMDFDELYKALHTVVGEEDEHVTYEGARLRVLGVCYDIRHAIMGDREIEFVDNGIDEDKMRRLSTISNGKNLYLAVNVLWPEILFVNMALNDFVQLYAKKQSKNNYDKLTDWRTIWDSNIAQVRLLQAAIAKCIKETISESSISRIMKLMVNDGTWFSDKYAEQYIDLLNCKFLEMDKEKRLKNITVMAKRIAEQDQEYRELKGQIVAAARENNRPITDMRIKNLEYPEDIDW
jgi:hypothetical protein